MKQFDLNIDKILEDWDLSDAIRELIANAIDEAILTNTRAPDVTKDGSGCWHVRDFGRGLRYQDLIQSENPEKIASPSVIGKFGIGLKDALATFERRGVKVLIKSRHGDITLSRVSKHSFEDLITLHASVLPASSPDLQGTDCCLPAVADSHVSAAKQMFLRFAPGGAIEVTTFGAVHPGSSSGGVIYVNGMKVAEEPNFLFSYNITSLNSAIRRALNRERRNVGRTAYAERVRSILLSCQSKCVAESLTSDLQAQSSGAGHDELTCWLDVQAHAARVLNAQKKVVFLNPAQMAAHPEIVDEAKRTGHKIVAVPERLSNKIQGTRDVSGNRVLELREFTNQREQSFQYSWVAPENLTPAERDVWCRTRAVLSFIGGRPGNVRDIRISETLSCGNLSIGEVGAWVPSEGFIVAKRTSLRSLATFAGVLLHEALHAKGLPDVSRDFESELTKLMGELAARVVDRPAVADGAEARQLAAERQQLAAEKQRWERERKEQIAAVAQGQQQLAAERQQLAAEKQRWERERKEQIAAVAQGQQQLAAERQQLAAEKQRWERERKEQIAAVAQGQQQLAAERQQLAAEKQRWERERKEQIAAVAQGQQQLAAERQQLAAEKQRWERERKEQIAAVAQGQQQLAAERQQLAAEKQRWERERKEQIAAVAQGQARWAEEERKQGEQQAAGEWVAQRLSEEQQRQVQRQGEDEAERQRQERKREARRQWDLWKRESLRRCGEGSRTILLATISAARWLARRGDTVLRVQARRWRQRRARPFLVSTRWSLRKARRVLRGWARRLGQRRE